MRIEKVLKHGQFVNGPEVAEFEAAMAEFIGVEYAIGCNSGTDALVLALKACGIGSGSKVAVPAFTFQATAAAVKLVGAEIVFADVKESDFGIDVATIEKKVDAIIAVDMFGIPADWISVWEFAALNGIALIEDAAQAMGAFYNGAVPSACGSCGPIGTTSFYPGKPLSGIGDGGMVFTDSAELARDIHMFANHGRALAGGYIAEVPGMNSRLDTIQAAVLLDRLDHFCDEIEHRRKQAEAYARVFGGLPAVGPAWSWYPVLFDSRHGRDEILRQYGGLGARVIYPVPLHQMPAFYDDKAKCPVAESICERIVAFPIKHQWENNACLKATLVGNHAVV